jgi:ribosomal protein S3
MAEGAKGVEIRLSGKFGSQRAREERFREGVIYRCGQDYIENVEYAVKHVLMPQGMIGVRVRIIKPGVRGPDAVVIKEDEIERIRERIKSEMESLSESEVVEIPEELEGELEVAGEVKEDESEQAR